MSNPNVTLTSAPPPPGSSELGFCLYNRVSHSGGLVSCLRYLAICCLPLQLCLRVMFTFFLTPDTEDNPCCPSLGVTEHQYLTRLGRHPQRFLPSTVLSERGSRRKPGEDRPGPRTPNPLLILTCLSMYQTPRKYPQSKSQDPWRTAMELDRLSPTVN